MLKEIRYKKSRLERLILKNLKLLALFGVFTLLISNTAACFASGLARSLAFATTAVFSAFAKIAGFNSLNMLHNLNLHWNEYMNIISQRY